MFGFASSHRGPAAPRGATLLLAAVIGGCDSPAPDRRVEGVPLSAELRPAVEASRRSLGEGDRGDPGIRADLDRYFGLAAMFLTNDRRAEAEDSLYALWSGEPDGILWPDLAAFQRYRIHDFERLQALFDHPGFPDASTALGAYLREWKRSGPKRDGSGYARARALRAQLSPFEDAWFGLRLARFVRKEGDADEALRLALEALPAGRDLGGWRLEMAAWSQIALALEALDDLDGALHAAVLAEDLAEAVAGRTGNGHLVLEARFRRAELLAERREVEPALALYESCADDARAAGLAAFAGMALNAAGRFTSAVGRYEDGLSLYRRALRGAIDDGDSLNVPRHLANIGRRHLILGRPDSCRVYLEEAAQWIEAYPDPENRARFPLMKAEYCAQVGDYAAVDSLLTLAETLAPNLSRTHELAELHLQLIRQGSERGRPAQAYRSIAVLDSVRGRLDSPFTDRNEVFDLDVAIAGFLGRQGLFGRAAEALDRADSSLARRPDPGRLWQLSGARGHLARRRGDPEAATAAYRACVAMSEKTGDADRTSLGKLWLASHHLDQDQLDEAESVLSSASARGISPRFRTRLSAALLRAAVHSRRARFEAAQRELDRARSLFRPTSPPDLLVRLDLETGRALAGLGKAAEARRAFASARDRLKNERRSFVSGDDVFLDRDLRRELVGAELEAALPRPRDLLEGPAAEAALRDAQELLPAWQPMEDAGSLPLAVPQIVFVVGADASYRWTVLAGSVALRRLAGEDSLIAALAPVLADLREPSREPVAREIASLTEVLGGPVPDRAPGTPLTIVPDGPLFSVPWSALSAGGELGDAWIDQGPVLIAHAPRDAEVGRVPEPPAAMRLLAVGADASPEARAAGLRRLRQAEREARQVGECWGGPVSLSLGETPGRESLLEAQLPRYDVIHISSHAQAFQGLADHATLFVPGADGAPVTAAEIRRLNLRAELVFLSCCEAVDGVRRGSGPGHAGLARSFLDAGARHVIASGIRVDDDATRILAVRFYEHWQSGAGIPDALRRAQLDLRHGEPGRAHPYYWAFFEVTARARGSSAGPTSQSEK